MNLILEKTDRFPFFTNMREVLVAAGMSFADFDWYVSDIETNYDLPEFSSGNCWITGEVLADLLRQKEVQFIWAVFSAVSKGFRSAVTSSPYVDGNSDYWNGKDLAPQLDGALFEIACWDSSATILIGLPTHAEKSFMKCYPETRPLRR